LTYPAYAWVLKLLRGRATPAALILIVAITLIVIIPGVELAWFLSQEAVALVKTVRALLSEEGLAEWTQKPWVQEALRWWSVGSFRLMEFKLDWKDMLVEGAQASSSFLVSQVAGVAQNVLVFAVNFTITLFTLFFFLRDGADFCARLRRLLPMDYERQQRLFQNIINAITAVVHGCLLVAMIQGLLAGLAYWLCGVPYAILWGVVTAFAALLPVGGTTLVSIPASLYLFFHGDNLKGILLLAWCLGVVIMIDNILKPFFIGTRIKMPLFFLFFGILGGLATFGALGLILGPVLFALLAALLDLYVEEYGSTKQ
jgi:predicted PurR-regulated permease PerM